MPDRSKRLATILQVSLLLLTVVSTSSRVEATGSGSARDFAPSYARPGEIPFPSHNAWSAAREELGRMLFFDPRLSASGAVSCASCHNPAFSWGDGLPLALGHGQRRLTRRTPTILNLAWGDTFFWDGRAASLEAQALGPIAEPSEMNLPLDEMVRMVRSLDEYAPYFDRAYPGEAISAPTVAKAIATFERTVVSGTAPFDRWVAGDVSAISEAAQRGFVLFNRKANCSACHPGWRFTDDRFHDIGVRGGDRGRGEMLPDAAALMHAFKTPTLRNVDRRGPFMHNGSETSLADVIDLYDAGGRVVRPGRSAEIRELGLSKAEKRDLIAFLKSLTSDDPPASIPALPR